MSAGDKGDFSYNSCTDNLTVVRFDPTSHLDTIFHFLFPSLFFWDLPAKLYNWIQITQILHANFLVVRRWTWILLFNDWMFKQKFKLNNLQNFASSSIWLSLRHTHTHTLTHIANSQLTHMYRFKPFNFQSKEKDKKVTANVRRAIVQLSSSSKSI